MANLLQKGEIFMKKKVRINRISIQNYKGIDEFELDFIQPKMSHDPDLMVMGSKNGIGKTSVIECCALLLLSMLPNFGSESFKRMERYYPINIPDLLIRAGADFAKISGDVIYDNDVLDEVGICFHRNGTVDKLRKETKARITSLNRDIFELVKSVCGFAPNPVIEDLFLLFHSYRKVQEGNLELGMMIDPDKRRNAREVYFRYDSPMSAFKLRILRSLVAKADLFEQVGEEESEKVIEELDKLVETYTGGKIGKLRPSVDSTVDIRINSINQDETKTFSFDSLSSGQKEIISTLFLIWYHTKENSSVVFIDEPELHLNSQWHSGFINALTRLAPQNQYIMATHSEHIMNSVEKHQQVFIS
jgi:AAA15 family ATPase/GTPase